MSMFRFRGVVAIAAFALITTIVGAQNTVERVSVAITYKADYAGLNTQQHKFWMQGGSGEISARIYRGLGAVADVTGLHAANTGTGVPLNMVTTTFGPRYTWRSRAARTSSHNLSFFGQGLIGEAHGFGGLYPDPSGPTRDALSFALQVGGGIDVGLSRHLAVRAVQINWLRTQMPNATTNVQNNLQVGTGLVFRFGE